MLRYVGVLIEHPGLYPRLSAQENLKIKCLGMGINPKVQVGELLRTVGLENVDPKKNAGSFSLGMRQRLGIALALVGDPKLIVLDEPTNGLDPQGIVEVRETLSRLRDEKHITIMISSHILDELARVADAYGIIHEGSMLDEFSAEELHKRSGQSVVIRTNHAENTKKVLEQLGIQAAVQEDGSVEIREHLDQTPAMAKAIVNAGLELREMYQRSLTLEEYYLGVTGGKHNG
jgi:ABC-2 type transport system ATP-binding protein